MWEQGSDIPLESVRGAARGKLREDRGWRLDFAASREWSFTRGTHYSVTTIYLDSPDGEIRWWTEDRHFPGHLGNQSEKPYATRLLR